MAEPSTRDIGIYFLDVGQGDCTVVVPPKGEGGAIVFDVADQFVLERFVANHELVVSDVVASHLDIDHIGGMLGFLMNHGDKVDRVYIGLDRYPKPGKNIKLRKLLEQVESWTEELPYPHIIQKDNWRDHEGPLTIREGEGWSVELVLPFNSTRSEVLRRSGPHANLLSAVLRVSFGGGAVLVGGDAPLGSWEQLHARNGRLIPAEAIRTPHHGGNAREGGKDWTAYTDLYSRVGAKLGVVSVGSNNGYAHPEMEHLQAVRRGGHCRLLCTQLTTRCDADPTRLREVMRRSATMIEPPYRQWDRDGELVRPKEVPCAGTIVVWLDKGGELHHAPDEYSEHAQQLIRVDHPLCE